MNKLIAILKSDKIPIILCCAYCFADIMLNTELIYLIPGIILSVFKIVIVALSVAYLILGKRELVITYRPVVIFLAFVVSVGTMFYGMTMQIFATFVFILLLREYKFKYILKYFYIMLWIAFLFTVFMSVIQVYPNIDYDRNGTDRMALGFGTPTLGQSVLMFLLLTKFYLDSCKISCWTVTLFFVASTVFYFFTAGRTGYFLTLALIIIIIFYTFLQSNKLFNRIAKSKATLFFLVLLPFIFLWGTLILTELFESGNDFAVKLNSLLSTRLLLQMNALNERSITIFGQNISWVDDNGIYIGIDNSYLYHLYNYGLIVFLSALVAYSYMLYCAWKDKDLSLIIVFIFILMDAAIEPYMLDFKYNYFVFYIGNKLLMPNKISQRYERSVFKKSINIWVNSKGITEYE